MTLTETLFEDVEVLYMLKNMFPTKCLLKHVIYLFIFKIKPVNNDWDIKGPLKGNTITSANILHDT